MTGKRSKVVDKLTISVIVDNSIEWFYPWPAEHFQPELMVHLLNHPRIDEETNLPVLDLENHCCGAHGLSLLLTTEVGQEKHTILFDAGPEGQSIERNLQSLHVDLAGLERIVLSHWHADHSGGILKALELRNKCGISTPIVVDVHPDRPVARGIWPLNRPDQPLCRLPEDPSFAALAAAGSIVEKHAQEHLVAGDTIYVSGEIPRQSTFETGLFGACQMVNGTWDRSPRNPGWIIQDERFLVIDVRGLGLVVLSSCSHAGIVNVCKAAIAAFDNDSVIYAVVGGFHLGGTGMEDRIPQTVNYFAKELQPPAKWVVPMHCTGFNAKVALRNALGDAVVPAGSGSQILLQARA